jgi:hypothetical protein
VADDHRKDDRALLALANFEKLAVRAEAAIARTRRLVDAQREAQQPRPPDGDQVASGLGLDP